MTINWTIRAEVVDISADKPRNSDVFLVDTNVWYWLTYSNAGHGEPRWRSSAMTRYADYLNAAATVGARLLWVGLSLAELAHRIEKTEHDIFEASSRAVKPKEYRHNLPVQRLTVVAEVQASWSQVKQLGSPLEAVVDERSTDNAVSRLQTEQVDGYDLFFLEAMAAEGVRQIITNDADFATVPGIQVFTSNRNLLQRASTAGRLVRR